MRHGRGRRGLSIVVGAVFALVASVSVTMGGAGAAPTDAPDSLPRISAGVASVVEGDSGQVTVDVPVRLSAPSSSPVTVDWSTFDSVLPFFATAGIDYLAKTSSLTIQPGDTGGVITIRVFGDRVVERGLVGRELGLLALSNPVGAAFDPGLLARLGVFVIVDDDGPWIAPGCRVYNRRVSSALTQTECDALVEFYAATGGDWGDDGWGTATDPCTWEGVWCRDGTVTRLLLEEKDVRGHLPAVTGALVNLEVLDLEEAGGVLSLPPEIGRLQKLQRLMLFGNQLETLPSEIGRLSSLTLLDVTDNRLLGDLTAPLLPFAGSDVRIAIADGPRGGNGCVTVTDAGLAEWLDQTDPGWNEACLRG